MAPVLFHLGDVPIRGYAVCLMLAFGVSLLVRRAELRRLGWSAEPRQRWVGLGALVGAVVGAKLGMLLFYPLSEALSFDVSGKTVVGALAGGYMGVELMKWRVGITRSTGDAFAVALPLGQAIGRIGCFLEGCCYGAASDGPLSVHGRHPTQLYEAAGDLTLAALLFAVRRDPRPEGHLFRLYLVGYALIRFALEPLRGDAALHLGPLTAVQVVCLAAALGFGWTLVRGQKDVAMPTDP